MARLLLLSCSYPLTAQSMVNLLHKHYHLPISNTAAAVLLLENT
jgi:hypothetical protein